MAAPRHHGTYPAYRTAVVVPSDLWLGELSQGFSFFPDSSLPDFVSSALSFVGTVDIFRSGAQYPYEPERVYSVARRLLTRSVHSEPSFIWMHTFPPHSPYLPPLSTRYRLLPRGQLDTWREFLPEHSHYSATQQQLVDEHHQRYRECIMGADEALGRMLDYLSRTGQLDTAFVIVTADHGESFEKGYLGHARDMLHESLIRVPLVIKTPGQSVGRIVQTPVSQADIAPTIFESAHAHSPVSLEGRSLVPALGGGVLEPAPVFSMTLERASRFTPLRTGHVAVIEGSYKLIYHLRTERSELYNLMSDPSESHDIAAEQPAVASHFRNVVQARVRVAESTRQRLVGG